MSFKNNMMHLHSLISAFVVRCWDAISWFYSRNSKPLASFCGYAGRLVSELVGNLECRFSRDAAQIWSVDDDEKTTDTVLLYFKLASEAFGSFEPKCLFQIV